MRLLKLGLLILAGLALGVYAVIWTLGTIGLYGAWKGRDLLLIVLGVGFYAVLALAVGWCVVSGYSAEGTR